MSYLRTYILIVDIALGVGAFAALFHSSFGVPEKVFFSFVFLLLAFMIEVYFLQSDTVRENQFEGLFAAIQALEKRLEGHDAKVIDAIETKIKELAIRNIAEGQGYPHIALLSARFGGWVLGGWLIERFLLPHL